MDCASGDLEVSPAHAVSPDRSFFIHAVNAEEAEEETTAARDEAHELAVHPSSDVYGAGPMSLNVDTSDYFPEGWEDYEAPAGGVDEELHGELSGGEEIEKIAQSTPLKPSAQEVDEHNVTHLPYRSWCNHCVRGRGRALAHQRVREDADDKARRRPRVSMDYFYLGRREEECLPLLAILEEKSQRTFSVAMPCKGVTDHQYPVTIVVKLLRCLGLQDAVLKTDTERSLVALRNEVQARLPGVGFEDAVKGESEANGPIENAVGKLQGMCRTLKSALEANYGAAISSRHPILPWLIDYAGTLLSRFSRGQDGRTPYERSTGKRWQLKLPAFGECVLFQRLKGERNPAKIEPRFEDGVYLGLQEGTALKWIGTDRGVERAWSVKRRPRDEQWKKEALESLVGLPWQLKPPVTADPGPLRPIEIELSEEPKMPEPVVKLKGRDYVPRGLYIRRDVELQQFGYTEGCDGCLAAQSGLAHRQHSRVCKARIANELSKTEDGKARVERVHERAERYIVAYKKREDERKRKLDDDKLAKEKKATSRKSAEEEITELDKILGPSPGTESSGLRPPDQSPVELLPGGPPSLHFPGPSAGPVVEVGEGPVVVDVEDLDESIVMDVGSLDRSQEFELVRREVSLDETAELMLDEEVEARRILLQTGALTVKAAYSFSSPVLVELFSPPRLTDYAQRRALGQGLALDLTTCDDKGVAWDFNVKERKDSASKLIESMSPDLLLGCPPCRMYSLLQYLNQHRIDQEVWDKAMTEAENHLEFCVEQYEAQMKRNKFFLHEHPAFATSWKSPSVERLKDKEGVFHVVGDMCEQDMRVSDEHGEGLAKKSTGYLTNSECIAQELSKRCSNDPDALSVFRQVNFSATKGQYPGQGGPSWERVQRRVTFDLTNHRLLQDLRDVHSATRETLEFRIPSQCKQVETVFDHIKPGKVWHRHVPLLGGKAKQCEVYPNLLLRSILKGLRKQLKKVKPMSALSFGPTNEEVDLDIELAPSGLQLADDWISFVDEISGKPLSAAGVRKARAEEIDYAVRYGVWDTVPIAEAYEYDSKGPISSRWIDINKGDEDHPSYRSRLVIQEIRQSHIEAVFAATPPLESVRMLLSLQRSCTDLDSKGRRKKVLFVDIRRAHWTARIFRRVYVRLPVEAGNPEGTCGRLNKAMYGCRDAAACWELEITDFFTTNGFAPGIGSPVLFVNATRDLKVSIHGDDITVLGFEDDLMWLYKQMGTRYEMKFGGLLGPDETDVQNVAILNRLVHYGPTATTFEADPRHVEIILNELNLTTAKTVSSPGVSGSNPDETLLTGADITRYRSLTMRANYLSLDRPDIAYATKELARGMQSPTQGHYNGLKRLARYLGGHRRLVWSYAEQSEQSKLKMFSDSDDGGCLTTRKSTSGGALMHGSHLLKFYSSTQHVISLSSGESEFYAGIKAGSVLLGGIATMQDLGCEFSAELVFDASAAKAMLGRRGHGKAKHIARCFLWLQQRIQDGDVVLGKCGTSVNPADLATKHLDGARIVDLLELMSLRFESGSHSMALKA